MEQREHWRVTTTENREKNEEWRDKNPEKRDWWQ